MHYANSQYKKTGTSVLKVDFKTECISRDREVQFYNNRMVNSSRKHNSSKIKRII